MELALIRRLDTCQLLQIKDLQAIQLIRGHLLKLHKAAQFVCMHVYNLVFTQLFKRVFRKNILSGDCLFLGVINRLQRLLH